MDELLDQFLLESRDLIAQATADFAALERQADDKSALDSAFRAMHTLKGSVAIFALGPAEKVLHRAEDVLERARKGTTPLTDQLLSALVACLDAIDRWVDDMEQSGALPSDAAVTADRLIASFDNRAMVQDDVGDEVTEPIRKDWVADMMDRERPIIGDVNVPLTLFRYVPDRDCFFRGEDPLAIAMTVPDLLALAVLPADGVWPEPAVIEPFACISILEGISGADPEAVRLALRLVASQVETVLIDAQNATNDQKLGTPEMTRTDVLRVAASRVDALADGIGELIVAVNAMSNLAVDAEKFDRALAASVRVAHANLQGATARLRDEVSSVRSVALGNSLRRLPRLAREIADGLGKTITFTITGEDVEVDRQIADALFEPLLHLVRNAIDHGAEPADERVKLGKPVACVISLQVRRDGDSIIATLTDDGRGIDPARIRHVAIEREIITSQDAAALDDRAALRLIFAPGFSTSGKVTAVSGRGVGMDAVQTVIERLRGTIDIDSEPGKGTVFRMRLPVSALTTRLLVVEVAGDRYGIALDQIVETVRLGENLLKAVGTGRACVLRERTVPVFDLGTLLGTTETRGQIARMLVTQATGDAVAVRVDDFAERLDAFVRPPSGLLAAIPGVVGSTLMGDGSVLLVLDLPELLA